MLKRNHLIKRLLITAGFLSVACLSYALFIEPHRLETKQVSFSSADIPSAWHGKKIVLLSDFHIGSFKSPGSLKPLVEKVNLLRPDIIVLAGDFVEDDPTFIEPTFAELKNLRAAHGVFAVLGNHDQYADYDQALASLQNANITPLENEAVWLTQDNEKIRLGGVTFPINHTNHFPNLAPTLSPTTEKDFVILASHTPDFAEELPDYRVDLMLSGHTHGGQVTFFGLFPFWTPSHFGLKYWRGEITTDRTHVIITNGIGEALFTIRFFAPPQITVITLEKPGEMF